MIASEVKKGAQLFDPETGALVYTVEKKTRAGRGAMGRVVLLVRFEADGGTAQRVFMPDDETPLVNPSK